ncbi:hypothetical protein BSKO_07491 [Bryopsis sp. KO-2023]|nr:hypothetical protein BSKO_07491 [Bryopsis sp. KO-2023]
MCVCMRSRMCLWVFWIIMAVVTGCYCALSLLTFSNTFKAYDVSPNSESESIRAILAAAFFGSVMVFLYLFVSFCTLLGKTIFRSGAGFTYGFITSSSIHMAMMCLLCGLVLIGFKEDVVSKFEDDPKKLGTEWGKIDTQAYKATFSMAFVSTLMYLIFFGILVFDKGAVQKNDADVAKIEASSKA